MTDADLDTFSAAYKRLGSRLGKAPDGAAIMDAFRDVAQHPLAVVEAALEQLGRSCRFMPRPVQLIEACGDAARGHATEGGSIPPWVNHDQGSYFCATCQDTGFVRELTCDGDGRCRIFGCGQPGHANEPHDYTRKCSCRPTNPVLERDRNILRRSAAAHQERV